MGRLRIAENPLPDLAINCLFVMALNAFERISLALGKKFTYSDLRDNVSKRINEEFLTEDGIYTMLKGEAQYTVLGNSLAILANVAGDNKAGIAKKIVSGELHDCSLSMKVLEYDALLSTDPAYGDFIVKEIEANYGKMLDFGSSTVWETAIGAEDFTGAGSLCHGWSSVPIYIFDKLGKGMR